jgi:hypothetical protein
MLAEHITIVANDFRAIERAEVRLLTLVNFVERQWNQITHAAR